MLFGIKTNLEEAVDPRLDGIELRIDLLPCIDRKELHSFIKSSPVPVLLTIRRTGDGGCFSGSEEEREKIISDLLDLHPAYVDLESDSRPAFIAAMAHHFPKVKIICSYHDLQKTPEEIGQLLASIRSPFAYAYKIATRAHSTLDALRMLEFVQTQRRSGVRLTGLCMGEKGEITRILGPVVGNFIDYSAASSVVPGILDVDTLCNVFRYKELGLSTQIYGLIGDPVVQSPSHRTHNRVFSSFGIDAVYIKMPLLVSELAPFFTLVRRLPVCGLSVTMPLKEAVSPYLDTAEEKAVNTIVFRGKMAHGYNTDGCGALAALETRGRVEGKQMVILGAGGAARAVAKEALSRGAKVSILNRTPQKAVALAAELGCAGGGFEQLAELRYEILVNCTPVGISSVDAEKGPIPECWILPKTLVMDAVLHPKVTRLLREAGEKGCRLVFGHEMFIHQAAQQFALWLHLPQRTVTGAMEQVLQDVP